MDATALADRTAAFLLGTRGPGTAEPPPLWDALAAAGVRAVAVRPAADEEYVFEQFGLGGRTPVERRLSSMDAADYDALVLAGGQDEDEPLFREPEAIRLATEFFLAGKPIAALDRGPALLVRAGLVDERMLTSWPGLAGAISAAGGIWHDCPVVVCRNGPNVLVTGRGSADVAEFWAAAAEQIACSPRRSDDARAR
ncbi:MAG TPA: DJ-1/PfpI family protein [Actinospica sp.]|jgi:protease I|nr:DJ-1/PfpI family protein [Actinospica sp.]